MKSSAVVLLLVVSLPFILLQGCVSPASLDEPLTRDDQYTASQALTFDFIKQAAHSDDLSGIAWVPDTQSYYLLLNAGGFIYEVDAHFQLIREIRIKSFDDPEDLTFLGMTESGPKFAIVEERGALAVGVIPDAVFDLDREMFEIIELDLNHSGLWSPISWLMSKNKGAEGVAFNEKANVFYVAKEKWPLDVLEVSHKTMSTDSEVNPTRVFSASELDQIRSEIRDLSSIHFDADSEILYLLSDESRKILTLDLNTRRVTVIKDTLNLPQPEGMTFGEGGKLIVVSEPYFGLVLERQ